jgi:hypothetical protein
LCTNLGAGVADGTPFLSASVYEEDVDGTHRTNGVVRDDNDDVVGSGKNNYLTSEEEGKEYFQNI